MSVAFILSSSEAAEHGPGVRVRSKTQFLEGADTVQTFNFSVLEPCIRRSPLSFRKSNNFQITSMSGIDGMAHLVKMFLITHLNDEHYKHCRLSPSSRESSLIMQLTILCPN